MSARHEGGAASGSVEAMLESGVCVGGQSAGLTARLTLRGPVAQLAEQQTLNLRVEGSIPSWLTT